MVVDLAIPATLGRYALLRPFAGDSERWLAFDPTLDRTLVLETIAAGDDAAAALRRGRAFAALDDPALAAVHDIAVVHDLVVLAREHVEGTPLRTWARSAASARTIVAVLEPVARTLAQIHAAGMAVGNLTADAIAIGVDGRARIVAPVLGAAEGSPAADCAALSAILFEALRAGGHAPLRRLAGLDDATAPMRADELARRLAHAGAPHRHRVLVVGVLGVLGVLGVAVVAYRGASEEPSCEGAPARLAGVWDEDARARVRAAFVATNAAFATDVAESVEATLDHHAEEWALAWVAACEERRAGELGEHEDRARTRCLEERIDAIAELVTVLAQADDTVVRNAIEAARAVEPAAACLQARAARTADSEATRGLRRELARASALQLAGKYGEALPAAQDVVRSADAIGDLDTAVEALRIAGILYWQSGDAATADATFETCIGRAWLADRHDIAALAWGQLVYVRAELMGDFAAAHHAARHAEATLARVGDDPAIAADILMSIGTLAQREGRYVDAIAGYADAIEAYTEAGADESRLASVRINLANAQVRADRLDDALANQQQALATFRRLLGDVHPETALARETLAAIHHARGDDDDALAEMRRVYDVRLRTLGAQHRSTLLSMANVGAMLTDLERWDEADDTLHRALADTRRFVGPDDPNVFFLLVNLALVANARSDHEAALRHCEDAERTAGSADHPDAATAMQCQGQSLAALGRAEEAIVRFREALAIRERRLGPDHALVARSLGDLGLALLERADGRAEAIASLRRALRIHERRRSPEAARAPLRQALAAAEAPDQKSPVRGTGGTK